MRVKPLLALLILLVLQTFAGAVYAQNSLNDIKIGLCGQETTLEKMLEGERKRGLVIDARPFALNQSTGKASFNGKTGHVSVVHMNPFVYRYNISVAQQELVSSAVTDFLELLLPPGLRIAKAGQGGGAEGAPEKANVQDASASSPIAQRLGKFNCTAQNDGCEALKTINAEFILIRDTLAASSFEAQLTPPPFVAEFKTNLGILRNEEANAVVTCTKAQELNTSLNNHKPADYLDLLSDIGDAIDNITLNANDLLSLTTKYSEDKGLKSYVVRCDGFNCLTEFRDYANSVLALMRIYRKDLEVLTATAQAMKRAYDLTEQMKKKDGVFARTFDVPKKFELTEATISIARVRMDAQSDAPAADADEEDDTGTKTAGRHHSSVTDAAAKGDEPAKEDEDKDKEKEKEKETKKSVSADVNETIQIGRPRFLLSGGLVFSPLRREAFDNVKGFTLDANGNPTGDGNKNVVGFTENSPRRLLPMVMLNTRLTSFNPTSLYFSLGVTAKHDDNIDVEYLLGPSVSLLNERALFTFGAYVGKVQNLVPDLKIGDEIPDSAGDAKLYTKRYSWKPGFSFTYVFSDNQKGEGFVSSGGGGGGSSDIKNEIRIGGIPFNLAMGLAYTSLEERTYDEIVGFARDREGKLTNGEKLTRIVGLTSSSGYRLVPLALLHSRLFDFGGNRSFYFSTGVTGKKTDDKLQIEYLLGGTVNAYRRKIFVTFGAFAGKQNVLGGNFFPGQQLDKDQSVTITSRYVWKPGFAISYDITRILKPDSQ